MSQVLVTEQYLSDIATAIRKGLKTSNTFMPKDMADGVLAIVNGKIISSNIQSRNVDYEKQIETGFGDVITATIEVN